MIQQIYITDYLSDAATETAGLVQSLTGQCSMLLKADWQVSSATPLAALFSALHLKDKLVTDKASAPTSIVSAVLRASNDAMKDTPVMCLLPVHLGLQRDTFSLQGTIQLPAEVYVYLTQRLQQHFQEDFIVYPTTGQRFWWIQPLSKLDVQSPWPQDCLYQQAFQWQPQGKHASLVRQWTNEIQMLLHQLSSETGLTAWPAQLNSLWFASVPALPEWQHPSQVVYGSGDVFDGLSACQLPGVKQLSMAEALGQSNQDALMVVDRADQVDWNALSNAWQKGQLSQLEIVLPVAERSVRISCKKSHRWHFWRKAYTLESLYAHLEASLPTSKLPEAI